MDLNNLKLFQMAMAKMDWASQRQKVLAQNVANADTPDYKEHDLKKLDFKKVLQETVPVRVARTDARHQPGTIPEQQKFRTRAERRTFEESPDGNKVVVEEQMQKVGDTRSEYTTAVTLIQAQMRMFKTALDRGGGG
jgi:flagellar basal-body rod protein FlgB